MAKKQIHVTLILSVDEHMAPVRAVQEMRERINDVACRWFDPKEMRVQKVEAVKTVRPLPKRCRPRKCWR
jgi:hypothetical protein